MAEGPNGPGLGGGGEGLRRAIDTLPRPSPLWVTGPRLAGYHRYEISVLRGTEGELASAGGAAQACSDIQRVGFSIPRPLAEPSTGSCGPRTVNASAVTHKLTSSPATTPPKDGPRRRRAPSLGSSAGTAVPCLLLLLPGEPPDWPLILERHGGRCNGGWPRGPLQAPCRRGTSNCGIEQRCVDASTEQPHVYGPIILANPCWKSSKHESRGLGTSRPRLSRRRSLLRRRAREMGKCLLICTSHREAPLWFATR